MTGNQGPFDEPLFDALVRHLGHHDRGAQWHRIDLSPLHTAGTSDWAQAGPRGVGPDELAGLPPGMPRFRYSLRDGAPHLGVMGRGYSIINDGRERHVVLPGAFPETMLTALAGRTLHAMAALPGADAETIHGVEAFDLLGVPHLRVSLATETRRG